MILLQAMIGFAFLFIIVAIILFIVGAPLLALVVRKILLKIFPVGNTKREFWIYVASVLIAILLTILLLIILMHIPLASPT
ncbi:putative neutral ceramidase superfamily lipid hydrolase [Dysgonomonas sp. PFB1-18]|nr:putative neutral ceramidase superfamily lipid hydrolase [Dysgonomonas sp. PF1-14]MDH6338318.1 putative neutral ceramidase superfamily lipid hydrolase [Dysgonomonas sp. PF1-16]MDH6379815.1 putative neutral ceramidase superfamily lipid hydrolase [Dysgonomonas sp. PFB1-18]MDH6397095.1 putative neutral ceramidase superfamily lipid hydrolase [Dysgonomonas sp. PF1-23]